MPIVQDLSDSDRAEVQQRITTKEAEINTWYQAALQKGWVVHHADTGYLFVEWHGLPDLAGLRAFLRLEGEGSKARPCPHCEQHVEDFAKLRDELPPQVHWRPVLPIPRERWHGCGMHCHHRYT